MNNNSARFNLTKKTPLMLTHMSKKLGYLAETEFATNILKEKFKADPEMDEYTNKFLIFGGKRRQLTTFSAKVLLDEFIEFWKGEREKNHHLSLIVVLGIIKQSHVVKTLVRCMHPFNMLLRNQVYV